MLPIVLPGRCAAVVLLVFSRAFLTRPERQHFRLTITEGFVRDEAAITREKYLDGFYVLLVASLSENPPYVQGRGSSG